MQFSESGQLWRDMPAWANFLVRFGFDWMQETSSQPRRICLLSMPADSAGAGLVALGCLRQRLGCHGANEVESHYRRILSLSQNGGTTVNLRRRGERGVFRFDSVDDVGLWLRKDGTSRRITVGPRSSVNWHFDGEPPIEVCEGEKIGYGAWYDGLLDHETPVRSENLRFSDSGIVLVGRPAGEACTRQTMEGIRLRAGENEVSLASLLTVNAWTPSKISRVRFYNCRNSSAV